MKKLIFIVALFVFSLSYFNASAEVINLPKQKISGIQMYDGHQSLGTMTLVIIGGKSLYIPADSKALLSILLTAYSTGTEVVVSYDTNLTANLGSSTIIERLVFVAL